MIIQWQSNGVQVLPIQLTPHVHIRNMYISDVPLPNFVNRIECKINKEYFSKISEQSRTNIPITKLSQDLTDLVLRELDDKDLFLTIPLFDLKRVHIRNISSNYNFDQLIGDSIITSQVPYKLIGLPTFTFVINGNVIDTPCTICPNKPIVPGFCLKYEDQYACVFACGIPGQEQENRRISLILSGVNSDDLRNLAAVDYNYDKYVHEYFQDYINREEDYND